jgi:hypothetical protein
MNWRIANVWCSAALLAVMVPVGAMAEKNPAKSQIKEGVKSGKLTRQDAKRLKAERKAFRSEVKAAKANGKISPEDKARLKAERNRLRDEIRAQTK